MQNREKIEKKEPEGSRAVVHQISQVLHRMEGLASPGKRW